MKKVVTRPGNGPEIVAAGAEGRKQKGMHPIDHQPLSREALLRLDHADWLETFAKIMQMQTNVEMTPMRAGVINRCLFAAEYIRMIAAENTKLQAGIVEATRMLAEANQRIATADEVARAAEQGSKGK